MEREFPGQILLIVPLVKQILCSVGRVHKTRHRTFPYRRQFLHKSAFVKAIQQDKARRHEARKASTSSLDRSLHTVRLAIPFMDVISHRVIQSTVHHRRCVEFVAQFEKMQLVSKRLACLCN